MTVRVYRVVLGAAGGAVLLRSEADGRILPIFIGGTEAISIGLRNDAEKYKRPLTHDLLDGLVGELGGRLQHVRVVGLEDNIFIGRVYYLQGSRAFDLDARPSDAIALALGNGVPIYVATKVLDAAAVRPEDIPDEQIVPEPRTGRPEEPMQL